MEKIRGNMSWPIQRKRNLITRAENDNVYIHYQGSGGVHLKNYWRQFLYAYTFNETKLLFSGYPEPGKPHNVSPEYPGTGTAACAFSSVTITTRILYWIREDCTG